MNYKNLFDLETKLMRGKKENGEFMKKGPFIVVSGHDLKDLEMLLEQTKGKGINIYTHGEMLPCHGYEGLKKYPHLVGNFGGAWQDQQKQFDNLPGCILMTTNCLMRPRESYKDRIYSTNVVGWKGVKYIGKKENGEKDFSEIIAQALELGGYPEDEEAMILVVLKESIPQHTATIQATSGWI